MVFLTIGNTTTYPGHTHTLRNWGSKWFWNGGRSFCTSTNSTESILFIWVVYPSGLWNCHVRSKIPMLAFTLTVASAWGRCIAERRGSVPTGYKPTPKQVCWSRRSGFTPQRMGHHISIFPWIYQYHFGWIRGFWCCHGSIPQAVK